MNKNTEKNEAKSPKRMTNKQRRLFNTIFVVIMVLVFAGVNVLAMFLVNKFPSLQIDLTAQGSFSLQDSSKEYFESLKSDITLKVLMTEDELVAYADDNGVTSYSYQINQLLKEMSTYEHINLEYTELTSTSKSALSQKYPDVNWDETGNILIVETPDSSKYKVMGTFDLFAYDSEAVYYYGTTSFTGQYLEAEVISAIQRITSDKGVKVALSVGNGEVVNENSPEYTYYTYLNTFLDDNAYDVETINLMTQEIPADIDVIMMIAPSYDLTDTAVDGLSKWVLNDGNYGKTIFYVPYEFAEDTSNIDLFLEQWGMATVEGYINENDNTMTMASANPAELYGFVNYANSTYTQSLVDATKMVLMPLCTPVEILDSNIATPLLQSSTVANVRLLSATDEESVEYLDATGEALNAAAIATKQNEEGLASNVIVWGSSYGLDNYNLYTYSGYYNNANYLMNMLNTITNHEADTVVVEGVPVGSEYMTVSSAQQVVVFIFFVLLIPISIIVTGIVVWAKRRNR